MKTTTKAAAATTTTTKEQQKQLQLLLPSEFIRPLGSSNTFPSTFTSSSDFFPPVPPYILTDFVVPAAGCSRSVTDF
jgi:hypothetical protein